MTMTNIRMKIAVAATVFGLGGLGGFAISSNPARNSQGTAQAQIAAPLASTTSPATAKAGDSAQQVSTRTSGAAAPPTVPAATTVPATYTPQPQVSSQLVSTRHVHTRTSGGSSGAGRGDHGRHTAGAEIERD